MMFFKNIETNPLFLWIKQNDNSPQSDVAMEITEGGGDVGGEAGTSSPQTLATTSSELSSKNPSSQQQVKLLKPLLSAASRLGKSLAELFGLLVKVRLLIGFYLNIFHDWL